MVSSRWVPWYDRPAREFPALIWLGQRYGFRVPRLAFARVVHSASDGVMPRPFPAKVWLEQRRHRKNGADA